ncbi:aspartyl-phosphate phosphatase Spo0E family protein [Oceanobacillus zhaokaii]|nr:aspartyl-phosphate phosphatase Spo0E family protein [Oceanobacillus zhaokaii]
MIKIVKTRQTIELQIERLRSRMYHAFEKGEHYDQVVAISKELDGLLNKLENLHTKTNAK